MRFKRSFQDTLLDLAQARQAAEAAAATAAQSQPGQVSWSPRLKGWKIFQAIFQPSEGATDLDTDDDDNEEPGQVEDPETLRILLRSLLSERREGLADFFGLVDTDGDGKVTVDELAVALQATSGLNAARSALAELCGVDAPPAGTPSPRARLPSSSIGFLDLQRAVWHGSPGQRASQSSRSPTERLAGARWGAALAEAEAAEAEAVDLRAPHECALVGPPSAPRGAASEARARSTSLPQTGAASPVEARAKGMSSSLWGVARGEPAKSEAQATMFETLQEAAKNQEVLARTQEQGSAIVVGAALEQGKTIAHTERSDAKAHRRLRSAKRAAAGPELPTDVFDFEDERAGRKQPYYMRGDARYDTPAGLKKRMKLLESGKVARAARQFWDALGLHGDDAAMSYDDYSKVHPNPNPNPNPTPTPTPTPTSPNPNSPKPDPHDDRLRGAPAHRASARARHDARRDGAGLPRGLAERPARRRADDLPAVRALDLRDRRPVDGLAQRARLRHPHQQALQKDHQAAPPQDGLPTRLRTGLPPRLGRLRAGVPPRLVLRHASRLRTSLPPRLAPHLASPSQAQ
jgi:hypothetical protein